MIKIRAINNNILKPRENILQQKCGKRNYALMSSKSEEEKTLFYSYNNNNIQITISTIS